MSREANRQAGTGVSVLDLMCDAQVYDASRFSSDGFHPNDAGYAYLAQRLQAIVNGALVLAVGRLRSDGGRPAALILAKHLRLEHEDPRALLPGVARKAGLDARVLEKRLAVQPCSDATCGSSNPR